MIASTLATATNVPAESIAEGYLRRAKERRRDERLSTYCRWTLMPQLRTGAITVREAGYLYDRRHRHVTEELGL
jgi:hypothetical protein